MPTMVQTNQPATQTSSGTFAIFGTAPTVGHSVILHIATNGGTISALTSTMGTMTLVQTTSTGGSGPTIYTYVCNSVTTASSNVSATFSGTYLYSICYEWSVGIATATNQGQNSGTNPPVQSIPYTPTTGQLVVCVDSEAVTGSGGEPASPWVCVGAATLFWGTGSTADLAYQIAPNTTALQATWSGGTAGTWRVGTMSFTFASASGTSNLMAFC